MRKLHALAGFVIVAAVIAVAGMPRVSLARQAPAAANQAAAGPYHVIKTFDVGGDGGWDLLAVDPDARRLYVPRGTHVMVIDADSGKVVGDIADTAGVHGVAIAGPLGKGFTTDGRANTSTVFDLKTLKVIQTVKTGTNPDAIVYEPVTKRVFAFNGRSNDVTVIDASDLSVAGTIALGGKPELPVVDGNGKVFVNMEDTSEVLRIDASTMKVEQRFPLAPGEEPTGLAIDAAHHRLFSACANQKMIVMDGESGKVLASPAIGQGPDGAEFDAAGGFALSSNGDGTMTVVTNAEGDKQFTVVQTLKTMPRARTLVIDPKTHHIYLPTAEYETPATSAPAATAPGGAASQPGTAGGGGRGGGRPRATMKPGSFRIVVVGP